MRADAVLGLKRSSREGTREANQGKKAAKRKVKTARVVEAERKNRSSGGLEHTGRPSHAFYSVLASTALGCGASRPSCLVPTSRNPEFED